MDKRLLTAYRVQSILNGLVFLFIAQNIISPDDLSSQGKLFFTLGQLSIASVGCVSIATAFLVFREKTFEEFDNEGRSPGDIRFMATAGNEKVMLNAYRRF